MACMLWMFGEEIENLSSGASVLHIASNLVILCRSVTNVRMCGACGAIVVVVVVIVLFFFCFFTLRP